MESFTVFIIIVCSFLFGCFCLGLLLHKRRLAARFEQNHLESKKILDQAQKEADSIIRSALKEAKESVKKRRKEFEEENKQKKSEIHKLELQVKQKESSFQEKLANLESREAKVAVGGNKLIEQEKQYLRAKAECELKILESQKVLERVAHMSKDEARKRLTESLEISAKKEAQIHLQLLESEINRESEKKSREIISLAIQRMSSDFVNDTTVTVVQLPNEEMKGRIIGREGRNIRAIEQATGVDIIIDDTPEAVVLSCFNPIRREIAKISLEKLIADERIHPARIGETIARVEAEFENTIKEYGEQAAFDAGITDLHPQLIYLLGKLYFKSTGAQSILQHSVETAHIAEIMALELDINPKKARRAALLHDIGKASEHMTGGHHAQVSGQICKKYLEDEDIVEAVRLHHSTNFVDYSPLALIVSAANNLSANRPGARKELLSNYIKRLEDIEALVKEYSHLQKVYVLQSGREVRALLHPDTSSDQEVSNLAYKVASRIRQEITFPGQIKITIAKESKHTEYAK